MAAPPCSPEPLEASAEPDSGGAGEGGGRGRPGARAHAPLMRVRGGNQGSYDVSKASVTVGKGKAAQENKWDHNTPSA